MDQVYSLRVVRRILVLGVLVLAACSGEVVLSTANSAPASSTVPTVTTTTLPTIEACDDIPYRPLVVPGRAAGSDTDPADLGDDPFTTIPGTTIRLWVDADSEPVMALVRGALPPMAWSGPTARVEVLREEAALGPLPDGVWAVAWFESEERCDLFTLVLYPPTSAEEALSVSESLIPDR